MKYRATHSNAPSPQKQSGTKCSAEQTCRRSYLPAGLPCNYTILVTKLQVALEIFINIDYNSKCTKKVQIPKRKVVNKMAVEITKETVIGDILDEDMETAPFFLEMGMHCLGCPASRGESIEDACAVHGVDPDELVAKLKAHFANK